MSDWARIWAKENGPRCITGYCRRENKKKSHLIYAAKASTARAQKEIETETEIKREMDRGEREREREKCVENKTTPRRTAKRYNA